MLARTPLSTRAKPFTPKADTLQAPAQLVGWVPVYLTSTLQATVASDCMQNTFSKQQSMKPDVQEMVPESMKPEMPRGRIRTKENAGRIPSRTPSPSGWSMCLSEGSTTAESLLTPEGSVTCTSASDLNEYSEDSNDCPDYVVKNTFIEFKTTGDDDGEKSKLSRSLSAPDILLACAFTVMTMSELHELGKCRPCAYFYGKADGCRQGSECRCCHMCLPGELKNRKKIRMKAVKARRAALRAEQAHTEPVLGDDDDDAMVE